MDDKIKIHNAGHECKQCGGFVKSTNRVYCSKACWDAALAEEAAARAIKNARVCKHCAKSFVPRLAKYAKYCSRECAFADSAVRKNRADFMNVVMSQSEHCKVYFAKCRQCGGNFTGRSKAQRLCSDECKDADVSLRARSLAESRHVQKEVKCPECSTAFTTEYGVKRRKFCSQECSKRHNARITKNTRKARILGVESDPIDPLFVFDLYGWECALCKTPTPRHLRGLHDDAAPELDHIFPLSKGGSHTYANVQLLCRKCNGEKSDTV